MRYALYVILILLIFIVPVFYIFKDVGTQTPTGKIIVTSSAFQNNQKIPIMYTCQGQNINPQLSFSNLPSGTKSLVLIINDPDSSDGNWIHWLAWDIDPANPQIEADSMATSFHVGQNSWNKLEYDGPCPPSGTHRYIFRVFALDKVIGLIKSPTVDIVNSQMTNHILDQGQLIGNFQ